MKCNGESNATSRKERRSGFEQLDAGPSVRRSEALTATHAQVMLKEAFAVAQR